MDSLFVYLIWFSVVGVLSIFVGIENAGKIVLGFVFLYSFFRGFISIKENIKIVKLGFGGYSQSQDLVINGIYIPLNTTIIAFLKLSFWIFFYSMSFWIGSLFINDYGLKIKNDEHNKKIIAPFVDYIKYIDYYSAKTSDSDLLITGKVLPINESPMRIDSLFYILPSKLLPKDTSEIKMILLIKRNQFFTAKYDDGSTAYHRTFDCKLFDIKSNIISKEFTISGTFPPMKKSHEGDDFGGDPSDELIKYLKNLSLKDSVK